MVCAVFEVLDQKSREENWDRTAGPDPGLVLGSSCKTGSEGTPIGASRVVSSHVNEGNGSSSDGTEVSSGGARGGGSGDTGAAGTAGVTGQASSSRS